MAEVAGTGDRGDADRSQQIGRRLERHVVAGRGEGLFIAETHVHGDGQELVAKIVDVLQSPHEVGEGDLRAGRRIIATIPDVPLLVRDLDRDDPGLLGDARESGTIPRGDPGDGGTVVALVEKAGVC